MPDRTSRLVDSFALECRPIVADDIAQLHGLSVGVGWMYRAEDWRFALQIGRGLIAVDEIGRAFGSAMWFPHGDDFATLGMMITTPRLQERGAGRWLMDQILSQVGSRDVSLNATRAAIRLYLSCGLQTRRIVYQNQGMARAPVVPDPCRRMTPQDVPAIRGLDHQALGLHRPAALGLLLAQSTGTVAEDANGRVSGFALCRRFGSGHVVGPVVAPDADTAIALCAPLIADHAGHFVRVDTHEEQGPFRQFLADCGLRQHDTVTTMTLGRPRGPLGQVRVFGLASHALG